MEKIIVKTPYTFERIQAYVTFTYDVRLASVKNLSYIFGLMSLLIMGSAIWCREYALSVIFALVGVCFIAMPTFVQKLNLHRILKELSDVKDKTVETVFDEESVIIKVEEKETVIKYSSIKTAFESRNNFYIYADYDGEKNNLIIADKLRFQTGIPLDLRDVLVRKKGKKLKLKIRND